ncbi:hypothetical protein Rs2_40549 [Raphanus sativus]|nr:hypothetical protein Rs2_40549 [Raphanus sativus]
MKDNSRSPNDGFHRYLKPGALAQIRNSRINNAIHLLPSCLAHYRIRHLLLKRYRRHASSSVQVASYSLSKISPASALCLFPLYSAATRWCHGASWRSPASLRAQTRITALLCYENVSSEHAYKDIITKIHKPDGGEYGKFYSLPALNDPRIDRLPYSIRILLESAIRNCDNFQ